MSRFIVFLQSLRGVQPIIVLAFIGAGRGMTIDELTAWTGLEHKSVRRAVSGMEAKNWLMKQRGAHGRVTWVPMGNTIFGEVFAQIASRGDSAPVVNVVVESEESGGLYSTTTAISGQNPSRGDSGKGQISLKGQSGDMVVSEIKTVKTENEIEACLEALRAAGIFGGKAERLAALNWTTPEYIRAHVALVERENWENPLGMAIYRMENNQPIQPQTNNKGSYSEFLGGDG